MERYIGESECIVCGRSEEELNSNGEDLWWTEYAKGMYYDPICTTCWDKQVVEREDEDA